MLKTSKDLTFYDISVYGVDGTVDDLGNTEFSHVPCIIHVLLTNN